MNNLNDIFFAPTASEELSYEQILEDVQRYFAENHAVAIAGEGDKGGELLQELMTQYLVKRRYTVEGLSTEELVERLYEDMAGYSFLKKWIYLTPGVEEVNINAYNDIEVIMNSGRSVKIPEKFSSPQHAIDVVRRMLSSCGMILDDTMPSVVGYLDKNIRISVDKTPIVDPDVGLNASIRIVNQQTVNKEKLLESGSATSEMLEFLTACIRYGVSVCIAGSTGSGKTTIMAWLLRWLITCTPPQIWKTRTSGSTSRPCGLTSLWAIRHSICGGGSKIRKKCRPSSTTARKQPSCSSLWAFWHSSYPCPFWQTILLTAAPLPRWSGSSAF